MRLERPSLGDMMTKDAADRHAERLAKQAGVAKYGEVKAARLREVQAKQEFLQDLPFPWLLG